MDTFGLPLLNRLSEVSTDALVRFIIGARILRLKDYDEIIFEAEKVLMP